MSAKAISKTKPAATKTTGLKSAKRKAQPASDKKDQRSFQEVVGGEVYRTWVNMLQELVPDGRTHRLALLVAAMLQYALTLAEEKRDEERDENSLVSSLLDTTQVADASEVHALLHDAVKKLFKDAKVTFERTSARGVAYSIVEEAYEEYLHWFNMPWD